MSEDRLVVLRHIAGRYATKTFTKIYDKSLGRDRIKETPYSEAKRFKVEWVPVHNLGSLARALDALSHDATACVCPRRIKARRRPAKHIVAPP